MSRVVGLFVGLFVGQDIQRIWDKMRESGEQEERVRGLGNSNCNSNMCSVGSR